MLSELQPFVFSIYPTVQQISELALKSLKQTRKNPYEYISKDITAPNINSTKSPPDGLGDASSWILTNKH